MGSISTEDYNHMVNDVKKNLDSILQHNKEEINYNVTNLKDSQDTLLIQNLQIPSSCQNLQGLSYWIRKIQNENKEFWICWNHYILVTMSIDELIKRMNKNSVKSKSQNDSWNKVILMD